MPTKRVLVYLTLLTCGCRDVKERQIEAVKEFPSALDYDPSDLANPDTNITVLFARILTQLEALQNIFLIERLLLKHGEMNKSSLLPISYRLVELTLLFWTHKDRFASFRNDFEWLVRQTPNKCLVSKSESIGSLNINVAVAFLGYDFCNPERRYTLHGATKLLLQRQSSEKPLDNAVEHYTATKSLDWLSRVDRSF